MPRLSLLLVACLLCAMIPTAALAQTPLGNAFTYQGQLKKSGLPYTGTASFSLSLWDAPVAGNQIGTTSVQLDVPVSQGVFTVMPDFGPGAFEGSGRWMLIQVKTPGDAGPTDLDPRQPLTAAPYALYAKSAPGGSGSSQWVSDGPDLTYSAGGVGVTGGSSPFASGKGVFLEGGGPAYSSIFAFDYDTFSPLALALNGPGGNVGIGTTTPAAKLDVVKSGGGYGIQSTVTGRLSFADNAAIVANGYTGAGVFGSSAVGVLATSTDSRAVVGISTNYIAVSGDCTSARTYGFLGTPTEGVKGIAQTVGAIGGIFANTAGGVAFKADGLAQVRTLQILGADLAESFPVKEAAVEPGTVLMLDDSADGRLRIADEAYSRRVAGVVSGANGLDAAVVLKGKSFDNEGHAAVALSGRVWVRCDATSGPIHTGDLLTTSATPGLAMAVRDRDRAFGAILGKAMTTLETGTGLVLVLVNLQ